MFFALLLGFIINTIVRALPLNASTGSLNDYTSSTPTVDLIVHTAGHYDPDNIAPDAIWDKYTKKGYHYQCLFEANDEDAGRLIEDVRIPPSAQSIWKGSMEGK